MGSTSRKFYASLQQFYKESITPCSLLYCYIIMLMEGRGVPSFTQNIFG